MAWRLGGEFEQFMKAAQSAGKAVRGKWPALLTALIIIGVLSGLLYFIYSRKPSGDYEGRIVDRWADYSESDQGSRPFFSSAS